MKVKGYLFFGFVTSLLIIYFIGVGMFSHLLLPGTIINGKDYSMQPKSEVTDDLKDTYIGINLKVTNPFGDEMYIFEDDVTRSYNLDTEQKGSKWLWFLGFFKEEKFNAGIQRNIDYDLVMAKLNKSNFTKKQDEPKDAYLKVRKGEVTIVPEVLGKTVDKDNLARQIIEAFNKGETVLAFNDYPKPEITEGDLINERVVVENKVNSQILIDLEGDELILELKDIYDSEYINMDKFKSKMKTIATKAKMREHYLTGSYYVREIDIDRTMEDIIKKIENNDFTVMYPTYRPRF